MPHSLFLCLTENVSGPCWPELASSGSLVKLLPRNGLYGLDKAHHFGPELCDPSKVVILVEAVESRWIVVYLRTDWEHLLTPENGTFSRMRIFLRKPPVKIVLYSMIHGINAPLFKTHLSFMYLKWLALFFHNKPHLIVIKRFAVSKHWVFGCSVFHQHLSATSNVT